MHIYLKVIKKVVLIFVILLTALTIPLSAYAASNNNPGKCAPGGGGIVNESVLGDNIPKIGCGEGEGIGSILKIIFGLMAVISVIFIAIGGIKYSLSGGDPSGIASAKNTILYAVVGLILGLSVFGITDFIYSQVLKVG